MKEFKNYHPAVNFIYFAFIIGFSAFFMHPVALIGSFVAGALYSFLLNGFEKSKKGFTYLILLMIVTAIINPLFNHEGVTVISYFPNGNPLTLESVVYGFFSSVMLASVILWFTCFNKIMTSDKIVYLFGRIFPSLSLVFSMTLSFVPRFIRQFKNVYNIQKCMQNTKKLRLLVSVVSIMITWSLENAVVTADSMKARGYGQEKRTAFSIYNFTKRDLITLVFILILGIYVIFGIITDNLEFSYFPFIKISEMNMYFALYFVLCFMPVIIEFLEVIKWKSIK